MGQASCCYCNCLSMQKSCLTKQTILLLMNAAAVQRCLSFWKSRFYGSFFFENRKLINYFCFTYLPAISFFANSVFLLLLVLTSISFHAIFQHLAFLQPLQKSCLVRLATRQTDRQSASVPSSSMLLGKWYQLLPKLLPTFLIQLLFSENREWTFDPSRFYLLHCLFTLCKRIVAIVPSVTNADGLSLSASEADIVSIFRTRLCWWQ